jgi:hypothetical protein
LRAREIAREIARVAHTAPPIIPVMDAELLTLSRAARRFNLTIRWLRAEAEAGRVPCLQAGARYLFELRALSDCLARRAQRCSVRTKTR